MNRSRGIVRRPEEIDGRQAGDPFLKMVEPILKALVQVGNPRFAADVTLTWLCTVCAHLKIPPAEFDEILRDASKGYAEHFEELRTVIDGGGRA